MPKRYYPTTKLILRKKTKHGRALLHIIIITYNRSEQLRRTLSRILEIPSVINFKVLVLDNASTDSTPEAIAEFASSNPEKVECVRHRYNIGLSGNMLRAMETSRGEYTWILADEDLLHPPVLEKIFRALSEGGADILLLSKKGWSQNNKPGVASLSQHLSEGLRFFRATSWITNVIFRTSLITDKTIHSGYQLTTSLFPKCPYSQEPLKKMSMFYFVKLKPFLIEWKMVLAGLFMWLLMDGSMLFPNQFQKICD